MIAYHATKSKQNCEAILQSGLLLPGVNVASTEKMVHLALIPFSLQASSALFAIGAVENNETWIITFEIPDETELLPDPSGEDVLISGYADNWMVYKGPLAITVVEVLHVPHVLAWTAKQTIEEYEAREAGTKAFLAATEEGGVAYFEYEKLIEDTGRLYDLSRRLDLYAPHEAIAS